VLTDSPQIGSLLLRTLMDTASVKVPKEEPGEFTHSPAFEHFFFYDKRTEKRHGAVRWHAVVDQGLEQAHKLRGEALPRHGPMLVRPCAMLH
jgi:hypothetical protein